MPIPAGDYDREAPTTPEREPEKVRERGFEMEM